MKCPKCKNEMEEGLLVDHYGGGYKNMNWVKRIKSSFWATAENETPVKSYRCKSCGYLENYTKQ